MLNDIFQDIMDAGSAFFGGLFNGVVVYGSVIFLIVLVVGVIFYFTTFSPHTGKKFIVQSIVSLVFLFALYMMAFGTNTLPDLSPVLHLPV